MTFPDMSSDTESMMLSNLVKMESEKSDVVDWEGPNDPENPRNWKKGLKLQHVLLVSGFTLYS